MNLGMSENFGEVDFDNLKFPVHLYVSTHLPSSFNIARPLNETFVLD